MDVVPCLGCGSFFNPRNKLQAYCSKRSCQAMRKKTWHREKIKSDREYRDNQKLSQKKWLESNPSYWKDYRKKNKGAAERNRQLQKVRNRGLHKRRDLGEIRIIAKMDARKPFDLGASCGFFLVPCVAKMDAGKLLFHLIPYT